MFVCYFVSYFQNFMGLVSDLSVSHPDRTKFRPTSDDWSHQLVFLYTMLLAATDRYLIDDSILRRHMTLLLHTQINSFSTFQWTGLQVRGQIWANLVTFCSCKFEILSRTAGSIFPIFLLSGSGCRARNLMEFEPFG